MVIVQKLGRWAVLVGLALGVACQGSEPGDSTESAPGAVNASAASAPLVGRPGERPAGVPADFVPTPNGYFHPSCMVTLRDDEVLGRDLILRGLDGGVRRSVAPCAYPHYTRLGRAIAPVDIAAPPSPGAPPPACSNLGAGCSTGTSCCSGTCTSSACAQFYDGWTIAYWWFASTLPPDPTLTGKWLVPPSPTGDSTSTSGAPVTLYYFDDVEMEQGNNVDILQPVLGYGYPWGNQWTITSWNCCTSGITATSTAVDVNPGDVIKGVTAGTNCDASSVCQNWTVTTTDLTTGKSTVLNTTEPNAPNVVNPAVLEAYGVTACDMFPPGGEETFFDTTLTAGADAGTLSLTYNATSDPNAGTPACGYAGTSSGDSYTIIYSSSPTVTATATALAASPTTAVVGSPVTLTATVTSSATSPTMGGNVLFYDGATAIGSADVAGSVDGSGHELGTASLVVSTLTGGAHQLTAAFGGDDGYSASTSPAASVTVTKIPTTTALTAAGPTTVKEGASIVVTATVTGMTMGGAPAPTGTVVFTSGTTSVGTAPLAAAGTATLTLKDAASYQLVAAYSGDGWYSTSTSSALAASIGSTVVVAPASLSTPPRGPLTLSTTGNVGAVTWALATNASGGTVDSLGHYTAGAKGSVTDVVTATDSLAGAATVMVSVGPDVSVDPAAPSAPPRGTVTFTATGGSGTGYAWKLTTNASGATIAPTGAYVAGATTGVTDTVQVTDSLGNVGTGSVSVGEGGGGSGGGSGGHGGGGCGCTEAGRSSSSGAGAIVGLGLVLLLRRRRVGARPPLPEGARALRAL